MKLGKNKPDEVINPDEAGIKYIETLMKTGLREGISDGVENNYQNYFDDGFHKGFKVAFAIGQYKGAIFAKSLQVNAKISEDSLLKDANKAWCKICESEETPTALSISEINLQQNNLIIKNISHLNSKYSSKIDINLINKLNI